MRSPFWIGYTWARKPRLLPQLWLAYERTHPGGLFVSSRTCHWMLDYSYTACGRMRYDSTRRPWREVFPQTVRLTRPGVRCWQDTREVKVPCRFCFILFRGADARLKALTDRQGGHAWFVDPGNTLGPLVAAMARFGDTLEQAGYWQAQGRLHEALELLRRAEPLAHGDYRIVGETPTSRSELVNAVTLCFRRHLSEKITLPSLARDLHIGQSTLSHRYYLETGMSPMKALTRLRVQAAKELLTQGDRLKTIAEQVGLGSEFNLSRVFKRVEGMSPRQFVRIMR